MDLLNQKWELIDIYIVLIVEEHMSQGIDVINLINKNQTLDKNLFKIISKILLIKPLLYMICFSFKILLIMFFYIKNIKLFIC